MKILFLVTEDWFFKSHFTPLAHRAREEGHEVVIAARESGAMAGENVQVIDMPFARRSFSPWAIWRQATRLQEIIDAERPDVIHAIALKSIALLMMANARDAGRVFALTGRGYLALARAPSFAALVGMQFRAMLRGQLDKPRSLLLVENNADRRWVEGGRQLAEDRVVLMPGAGVDPASLAQSPEPAASPIVVGVVSRLIRSKGIDTAVNAISKLRARGANIVLRIAGGADPENPEHVGDAEIARWRATPGVELVGRISDVSAFWAGAHIACLPSRGGEGLPRSLLEAAASGRPIVTTDAPGCIDFVGDQAGIVVPRDDAGALAMALEKLANDGALRRQLGAQARARIEHGYTLQHAAAQAAVAWSHVRRSP